MPRTAYLDAAGERVLIRLDTFIRLRWYAIIGQAGAVLVIAFGFGYSMPWPVCLALVLASMALNLLLTQSHKKIRRLPADGAFALLAFDVVQLGVLLFLTGGLQNPFSMLLIAPVVVSATSLNQSHTLRLGALVFVLVAGLAFFHLPLPWKADTPLEYPFLYVVGVWVAVLCTLAFTAIYVFRVAEEARRLADALTATELVLQREQHLSALDGLAAAAAHELGTPLSTIALVSKEMTKALPPDSPLQEDAALLRSQAQRCREILGKLTSLSSEGVPIVEEQTLTAFVEEVIAPLRTLGVDIVVDAKGDSRSEPRMKRGPGVQYGLSNMIDNAVDFAVSRVQVDLFWNDQVIEITVRDNGPGFPGHILKKLGEPFVTSRKRKAGDEKRGMGLGLFIAKTLIEREGAAITFSNNSGLSGGGAGAVIVITWERRRP
ncbi:MAG: ActS/PrrB/RegB family redox-sensitive histidine kinase [Pseudomonadota bacterium]